MASKTELKNYFQNGDVPNRREQFWAWMDSYWHKYEYINSKQNLLYKCYSYNSRQIGDIRIGGTTFIKICI